MKRFLDKIKWAFLFTGLAILGACATQQTLPPGGQTTEAVISACDSFSSALTAVIPFKSKMSSGDISKVNAAILLASPICHNPASYNSNGAISAIVTETGNLSAILKANGGKP